MKKLARKKIVLKKRMRSKLNRAKVTLEDRR